MRYVPNLIPEESRVLKDYFKGDPYQPAGKGQALAILSSLLGVLFFCGAVLFILHPIQMLLFVLMGLLLFTPFIRWFERKFRYHIPAFFKYGLGIVLLAVSIPLGGYYRKLDKANALVEQQQEKQELQVQAQDEARNRQDSFASHILTSRTYIKSGNLVGAQVEVNRAMAFSSSAEDIELAKRTRTDIKAAELYDLVRAGKHKTALREYTKLIEENGPSGDACYYRAICYSKTKNIPLAVKDCKEAIKLGNDEAEALHNKINPPLSKIAGYLIRCCDGTADDNGKTPCDGHKGVCNWKEPYYKEYRKYE